MEKKLLERILQIRDVELPRNKDEIKRVRSLPNFLKAPSMMQLNANKHNY